MRKIIIKILSIITVIPFIYFFLKKRRKRNDLRKRIMSEGKSFSETAKNITNSISKSKKLYKRLIIKVHPDKFSGDDKFLANDLSSKITKSKKNYNELSRLKIEVDSFLNKIRYGISK